MRLFVFSGDPDILTNHAAALDLLKAMAMAVHSSVQEGYVVHTCPRTGNTV